MFCSEDECVCSVKKENKLGYYRLHTIWRKDGFFINVTSKNGAWCGEMTPGDVAKFSAQLETDPESYVNDCKKALTYHGGQPGIVYAVEDGNFLWKKVEDEDSGIKLKLGSVMLEPASFEDTIQNLVTAALNCNKTLQEKLNEMTEENKKAVNNKNKLLKKLNQLIKTKETMENDLYAKFILLNNAKKRKIQELENLLKKKQTKHTFFSENLDKSYEVETDDDLKEEMSFAEINKEKKMDENTEEDYKMKSSLSAEEPDKKKVKSLNDENTSSETSNCLLTNKSKPSTSAGTGKKVNETRLTQDELYDYFYGEL